MTRRKLFAFAVAATSLAVAATTFVLLSADLYLHHRAERSAGLNRWGYRGPVAGRKQTGEIRVAMLGGSTTFGYGVNWNEAIPAQLEAALRGRAGGRQFTAINLGFNNEGAYASLPALQDYAWLDYDIVALYHGYNDLLGDAAPNTAVFRHESPVFRMTGYFPILPLVLQEKAMALRAGGNIDAAYRAAREGSASRVAFTPNLAQRTSATALQALSDATMAVGTQLDKMAVQQVVAPIANASGCDAPWVRFCDSIDRAVTFARRRGAAVLVIAQPTTPNWKFAEEQDQREQLRSMIQRHYGHDKATLFVDLSRAVNPSDPASSFDGMHLNAEGNGIVARALADSVREAATSR